MTPSTMPRIRRLGAPGDLGWVVMAHGELYAAEFGFDSEFESLVASIVVDYAAIAGTDGRAGAWVAEQAGRRVGCVFCVPAQDDPQTAKLRILLVVPEARGHGLGRRLVDTCVDFAQDLGYDRVRLWTNHPLAAARRIYLACGFELVEEQPHRSFGVELIGQTYELALSARPAAAGQRD